MCVDLSVALRANLINHSASDVCGRNHHACRALALKSRSIGHGQPWSEQPEQAVGGDHH